MTEKNRRILVVDDEAGIRFALEQVLSRHNYETNVSEDLSRARALLAENNYDLVMTDLRLGGDRGEDLIKFVKEKHPETGVIVMTGYADIKSAVECMKAGADDYIAKPFEMDEIVRVVTRFFETKRLKKEISNLKDIVGLYRVAIAIARLKPLDEVLELILKTAEKQVSADGGSIALWEEDDNRLIVKVASGPNRQKALGQKIRLGERVAGYAAQKKEPVIVHEELNKDPRFRHEKVYNGVRSGMSIPMLLQDKLIGTLNLKRTKSDQKFSHFEVERVFVLAQIAALAISNARVFDKIRELDKMKSEFIATVSHELRTPLTAIKAAAELEEKFRTDRTKCQNLMDIVRRNAIRMRRLVEDLLDFSKLERRRLKMEKKTVDFVDVIKGSVKEIELRAKKKNIAIFSELPDGISVFCDPYRMEQVFTNIIGNAIKFSPAGSRIEIALRRLENFAEVSITDEGVGIPRNEMKRIFERFYQIDDSLSRPTGGFGLGLSIVREILDLHGGEVSVESPPEGRKKGTRFIVKVPLINAERNRDSG